MLLTILVAHRIQEGTLEPEDAKSMLSDLMGVDEEKRAQIRTQLEKS